MIIAAAILGWLACGVFAAGAMFAYIQDEYPLCAEEMRGQDQIFAWAIGLVGGPFAGGTAIFMSGFLKHGWRLR
jgi:hypothetical protein